MTRTVSPSPELVAWLRRVAPKHKEGTARGFAFNMDRVCLQELNAKINEAADALESAQSEIARLTTALERIEEHYTNTGLAAKHMAAIARAALKDSPNVG